MKSNARSVTSVIGRCFWAARDQLDDPYIKYLDLYFRQLNWGGTYRDIKLIVVDSIKENMCLVITMP